MNIDQEPAWRFFYALRLPGGIPGALRAVGRAWWGHLLRLTLVNFCWFLAFFSIIGLPAATATLFFAARHALAGEEVGWEAFWFPIQHYFWEALRWGIAVGGVGAVALLNLWAFRAQQGTLWDGLRGLWITVALGWLAINLFFWPFWWSQAPPHRTLRTTWRNSLVFLRTSPQAALLALLISALTLWLLPRLLPWLWMTTLLGILPALVTTALVVTHLPRD